MELSKKKSISIDIIFVMTLFAIFTILSSLVIVIGINVYKNISVSQDNNNQIRTTLTYIVNKVRANDEAEMIYIENKDNTDILVFESDMDGTRIQNLIFCNNGELKEATIAKGDDFDLAFGDVVIKTKAIDFDIKKNRLIINVKDKDGKDISQSVNIKTK